MPQARPTGMENAGGQGRSAGGRWRGPAAAPVDNGAWPQYPQTTATPRPDKFRMQFPHDTDPCTLKNRRISTIRLQHLKYTQGNCMRNCRNPVRTQHHATTRPHWCGGHRQGLAGQRVDAPSEARGADGSRAGRRPRRSPAPHANGWSAAQKLNRLAERAAS